MTTTAHGTGDVIGTPPGPPGPAGPPETGDPTGAAAAASAPPPPAIGRTIARARTRNRWVALGLTLAAAGAALGGLAAGDIAVPPAQVVGALTGVDPTAAFVVIDLRLPRVAAALAAGAALGLAGALLQSVARNPLASPDVLGVTAGAAVGAVAAIAGAGAAGPPVAAAALVGALAAALAVRVLAGGHGAGNRLILTGIGVHALLTSMVSFLLIRGSVEDVGRATVWLVGSVHGVNGDQVQLILVALLILVPLALALGRALDGLELGDDLATALGVRVHRRRTALLAVAVALAAVATATAGPVAFVALAAPQAARVLGRATRPPLGTSALAGAALTAAADLVARRVAAPTELPAGVITALVGAPVLLVLVGRRSAR